MRTLTLLLVLASFNLIAADRPNIIMIMADDIGYENFSCYGSTRYKTPHIDSLAKSGIRFNHAHSQPICTPSRVQIMTGIYNNRNYIRFGLLDPTVRTFGHVMKEAGYKTCVAGKWQLGGGFEGPGKFGFENYCLWHLTRRPNRYPNPGLEIDGEEKDFKDGQFGPDVVSDYVCEYVTAHKDTPFFLYYPMIAPHWPFVPTPEHPDWDPTMWRNAQGEPGGYKDQKYWEAMVVLTDRIVGRLVNKLDELGIRDNTLIMFTGDNGSYTGLTSEFDGRDYKGGKGSPKDNGTHVPFVASWPKVIKPGQVRDDLIDLSDMMPTIAEVGNAKAPADADGASLVPVFRGQSGVRNKDYIYCWYERNGVREKASEHTRTARYKLYATGAFYDVQSDPGESKNLARTGIPEQLRATHAMLRTALDKHVADTKIADPIQNAKRGKPQKQPTKPKKTNKNTSKDR